LELVAATLKEGLPEVSHQSEVLLPGQHADAIRIPVAVAADDRPGPVRRAVFPDHDFVLEIRDLGQNALDGLRDESLLIVRGDQHTGFHGPISSFSNPIHTGQALLQAVDVRLREAREAGSDIEALFFRYLSHRQDESAT
jgi:hypothetical protein